MEIIVSPVSFIKDERKTEGEELCYGNLYELVQLLTAGGLANGFTNVKKIHRKKLIDYLNYLNFSEGEIVLVFKHPRYNEILTRVINPEPCQEETLFGNWRQPTEFSDSLRGYESLCFLIENKRELLIAPSQKIEINAQGIRLTLPELAFEVFLRKTARYPCHNIQAQLIQNGFLFSGRLLVFSVNSFLIEIVSTEGVSLKWINTENPVQIIFRDEKDIFFSGECAIVKQTGNLQTKRLVLQPIPEPIHRFKRRAFRAPRQTLHPSPAICYVHPLINKLIKLTVCDLSTAGFSVEEEGESSTLLPGMILPDIQLDLAYANTSSCKAQVIYKNNVDDRVSKSGFTILNMSNTDYVKLTNLVNKSLNNNLDVCGAIELESLWGFFFQSGFIYPQKYEYIQQNKDLFKKIYQKLYDSPTEIERHITYQERGTILGHISLLHVYETTWMLHHFAATPNSRHKKVALTLMEQIERYILDSHYLESSRMDYVICFFRPENKFPNLVFGGAARSLKDPKICSLDRFAYYNCVMENRTKRDLPESWKLTPTDSEDLNELGHFYKHTSGGQMLEALDLLPEQAPEDGLTQTYHRAGFKRRRLLLSIKKKGKVKAIINLVNTDIGLNLSELTNSISLFILEPEDFPFEVFLSSLSQMSVFDERPTIPVLVYPIQYADRHAIAYERIYDLWVFAVENSDHYFKYVNKVFSRLFH